MDITSYLRLMVDQEASDLFFTSGAPVNVKIEGNTSTLGEEALSADDVRELAYSVMNERQIKAFERNLEMDLAVSLRNLGRFRVNVFRQRGEVAMVVRYVKSNIPTIEELDLPVLLKDLVMEPRGLVLIVGTTGSGKSTTLAAMIEHRNKNETGHILTIEDPIEYLHQHRNSLVNQREIGVDTYSYRAALKHAMREAPDVILIGEIRDRETMEQAISYAETGHLCLSTLHAANANQAMERIVNFFPEDAQRSLFMDLSLQLRGIVSQRLIMGREAVRVPAVEVMLSSPYIRELIQQGEFDKIKEVMERSREDGMQTFDQAVFELYRSGRITEEQALRNADSRQNVSVWIRLEGAGAQEGSEGLSLNDEGDWQ